MNFKQVDENYILESALRLIIDPARVGPPIALKSGYEFVHSFGNTYYQMPFDKCSFQAAEPEGIKKDGDFYTVSDSYWLVVYSYMTGTLYRVGDVKQSELLPFTLDTENTTPIYHAGRIETETVEAVCPKCLACVQWYHQRGYRGQFWQWHCHCKSCGRHSSLEYGGKAAFIHPE